jgi:hypothetical protein
MMVCQGASSLNPSKCLELLAQQQQQQQQNATLNTLEFACFLLLLSQLTKCFRHYYTSRYVNSIQFNLFCVRQIQEGF